MTPVKKNGLSSIINLYFTINISSMKYFCALAGKKASAIISC